VLDRDQTLRTRLEFHIVGAVSPDVESQLDAFRHGGIIRRSGVLPKSDADRMMRGSDLLLLINEPIMARYIPGKLYEYVASGTPVLSYGTGGEIGRVLEETGAGVAIERADADALERVLVRLAKGDRTVESSAHRQEWLDRHTREASARAMFDLLDGLAGEQSVESRR
jgi:glycosyltransferase involved in cell wall biosynthesis